MFKAKAITEGAILIALFSILLLTSIFIPILGQVTMFALSIPFIVYTYRHPRVKNILTFFFVAIAVSYIITGVLGLPLTFAFGTAGLVMGYVYVHGKSAFSILIAGSITFLLDLLILYGVSVVVLQINLIDQMREMFIQSFETAENMIRGMGQVPDEQLEEMYKALDYISYIIPSVMIIAAVLFALITQFFANKILRRLKKDIPTFPPFREWRFPQSILWYYLIVMILTFMKLEEGSTLHVIVINGFMILEMIMFVQGLILIFYFAHAKGWKKGIPIMVTVFAFFIPILLYLIRFLGIIDLGFDLRKRIKQEQ